MYEWKKNYNGNFVGLSAGGCLEATVFSKDHEWQIILNGGRVGQIVAEECFSDSEDAMGRAEAILDGAKCTLVDLRPRDETTGWKQQKTTSNGSPTYGRKHEGMGVSVKKAKSGQWYYVEHSNPAAQGWYGSAEEAMQAFDSLATW